MSESYSEQQQQARQRLRAATRPAMADEQRLIDWLLSNLTPGEADVFSDMIERRARLARRAGRMALAAQTLAFWNPAPGSPVDIVATFEHIAAGGDQDGQLGQLERDQQVGDQRRAGEPWNDPR